MYCVNVSSEMVIFIDSNVQDRWRIWIIDEWNAKYAPFVGLFSQHAL